VGVAVVLLLTIPMTLLLQDFTREVFLVELSRLFWGMRILIESLPQILIWGVLLAVLLVIALRSLGRRRVSPAEDDTGGELVPQGPVQVLTRWIQRSSQGEYFRWSLGQHLAELAWDVMAQRERTTPGQLKERLRAGRIELPPVIEDYMQHTREPRFMAPADPFFRLRARLRGANSSDIADPALESVIEFLEDQIQIVSRPEADP
jgi:hypothetical protein